MLYVVGFGAGNRDGMTIEAEKAILSSDLIVGYSTYTELLKSIFPEKEYLPTGMKMEKERVVIALENAALGKKVSLVCSGDSGVYGMAGLAYELSENYSNVEIEVIAGVTAALSGAAIIGAPLTNDFAVISLSDLLTPWKKIEKRLECISAADLVAVLYNPSSKKRTEQLKKACEIIMKYRDGSTVCGYVKNIGRQGEEYRIITLSELGDTALDMFSTVFIGNSETKLIRGKMVTPRGYRCV